MYTLCGPNDATAGDLIERLKNISLSCLLSGIYVSESVFNI